MANKKSVKTGKKLPNIHPGDILAEDFLAPLGISQYQLAKELGVPLPRINQICRKERGITPEIAIRLAKYFGTTPKLWLNLQASYDLEEIERTNEKNRTSRNPYKAVVSKDFDVVDMESNKKRHFKAGETVSIEEAYYKVFMPGSKTIQQYFDEVSIENEEEEETIIKAYDYFRIKPLLNTSVRS